jgi:hypothetical protein
LERTREDKGARVYGLISLPLNLTLDFIREVAVVNRGALLLRYLEPAVRWINDADPHPSGSDVTLADVNEERTVYLIHDTAGDDPATLESWLRRNYAALFEAELEGWYTDPSLWPKKRNYEMFRQWFVPECHTVVIDVVGDEIVEDEI